MNIAVIDDSIDEARQLAGFINTYFTDAHLYQQTSIFNTAAEFFHSWHIDAFNLVFIDIYLKGEAGGIRIAESIRREDDRCAIIFITSSADFALKGFEVRALDYIVKPLRYGRFRQSMDYYRSVYRNKSSHYIQVKESRIMVKLPINHILYTDYSNHYIQIHLYDKTVRTYMKFQDFSNLLLCYPQFLCCYRNCILNMDKVCSLEKTEFVLTTGEHLPITRNLRPQIHQQYADYQFLKLNGGMG